MLDIVYIVSTDMNYARIQSYDYEADVNYDVYYIRFDTDGATGWTGAPTLLHDHTAR